MSNVTSIGAPRALSPSPFDLSIQGVVGHTAVRRFTVRERISEPYLTTIELDAVLLGGDRIALGTRARLQTPRAGGTSRAFHGVIASVERRGSDVEGAARFRLTVEPLFAGLRHTRHRRIFHDKTSVQVAEQILREHRVPYRLRLLEERPVHTHRIQYDESDLAFVERILFEEGIFYFFDHPVEDASDDPDATNLGKTEVLVLCDTAQYYPRAEVGQLVQRAFAADDVVHGDATTAFDISRAERTRPQAFLVRGRDPQRPVAPLGDHDDRRGGRRVSVGDGDPVKTVFGDKPRLVYESQGTLEDRPPVVPASRQLHDEARADAVEVTGGSLNPTIMPGRIVRLEVLDAEPEDLVIVAAEHVGESPRDFAAGDGPMKTPYRNDLVAAPAAVVLRPARRAKPRVDGFDAAIVVGPEGEEIFADVHGRVKVRFLWDLESAHDDKASAWLRVMQPWAGAGFGAQFLPRVGMEVVVAFMGGDVDRPMVAGCVHNGVSPPPFRYPEEKTVSGIRTRTSPGGVGLHEIVLDDALDKERISIRSQGHLSVHARGEHALHVEGGAREQLGSLRTRIEQEDVRSVGGPQSHDVGGARDVRIGAEDRLHVAHDRSVLIERDSARLTQGDVHEEVGGNYDLAVGTRKEGGFTVLRANGPVISNATGRTLLISDDSVFVYVGETRLEIERAGIRLTGARITLQGDRIDLVAKGSSLSLAGGAGLAGGEVVVSSKGAQLRLDDEAHLDGTNVKLNCGPGAPAGASVAKGSDEPGQLKFKVTNPAALHGQDVVGTFLGPDGQTVERAIPPDGEVTFEGKAGDRWTLIDVRAGKTSWGKRGE